MAIDPTRSSDIRPGSAEAAAEAAASERAAKVRSVPAADRVEISDEARALAEQGGADRVPFTEARLNEVKQRLESGHYGRPEVVREIAERLLDSGDL